MKQNSYVAPGDPIDHSFLLYCVTHCWSLGISKLCCVNVTLQLCHSRLHSDSIQPDVMPVARLYDQLCTPAVAVP